MTAVAKVASAFNELSISKENTALPRVVQHLPVEAPKELPKSLHATGIVQCTKLQAAGILGPTFNVLDEKALGNLPAASKKSRENQKNTLSRTYQFCFFSASPEQSYTLYVNSRALLQRLKFVRESQFSPLKSISIPGSWAAKILGPEWYSEAVGKLRELLAFANKLKILGFDPSCIDASHIDNDPNDIDFHIDATEAQQLVDDSELFQESTYLERVLLSCP